MPPTLAAARKTYSGRALRKKPSTAARSARSTSLRTGVSRRVQPARLRRRTMALPTRPRDPATKIAASSCMAGPPRLAGEAGVGERALARRQVQIVLDHQGDQLLEAQRRLPAEDTPRLGGIALQGVDLGRPEVARIDLDMLLPVQPGPA